VSFRAYHTTAGFMVDFSLSPEYGICRDQLDLILEGLGKGFFAIRVEDGNLHVHIDSLG
jgi:hypothetical protein